MDQLVNASKSIPLVGTSFSEAEYASERAVIRRTCGDTPTEALARHDQALASLFVRSGWTVDRLAEKESKAVSHIKRRIIFGRFLAFSGKAPVGAFAQNLTERRFRGLWVQFKSEKNERIKFSKIAAATGAEGESVETAAKRRVKHPEISKGIIEGFSDGQWHSVKDIAAGINASPKNVEASLKRYLTYNAACEKKRIPKDEGGSAYRVFKTDTGRLISPCELKTKLRPLLAELKLEGKKNMATMSPGTVARIAFDIENLLKGWGG